MIVWYAFTILALLSFVGSAIIVRSAVEVARIAAAGHVAARMNTSTLPCTVLKPLHGADPELLANLTATLRQDQAAPYEVLFVVRDPVDPAASIAECAIAKTPETQARLIRDARLHGANRKISQLVNLDGLPQHDILVIADADIAVPSHWLQTVTTAFSDSTVGLVTCLYRGKAGNDTIWSKLGSLGIDWQFLPNAAFGERMNLAKGCYGATMAIRLETLREIGGFYKFVNLLADDYAIGTAVRKLGQKVVVAPVLPFHVMTETNFTALFAHEFRWARTLRTLNPHGYFGMIITHPTFLGFIATFFSMDVPGFCVLSVAISARIASVLIIDASAGQRVFSSDWLRRLLCLPFRELLSFLVWIAGLLPISWPSIASVEWRGQRLRLGAKGEIVEASPAEAIQ